VLIEWDVSQKKSNYNSKDRFCHFKHFLSHRSMFKCYFSFQWTIYCETNKK